MPKTLSLVIGVTYTISVLISCLFLNKVIQSHDNEVIKLVAADVYDKIYQEMLQSIMVARTIANDNFLKQNLKNESNIPRDEEISLMSSYLKDIQENFSYDTAFVISDASKVYYYNGGFNRVIEPEKNPYDVWYKNFVASNVAYDFNVDSDEFDRNSRNVFINARIEDENKNLLGICGISLTIEDFQKILADKEKQHNIKIDLFDFENNFAIDANAAKFKDPQLRKIIENLKKNPEIERQFVLSTVDENLVIARAVPQIKSYLIIRRNINSVKGIFSSLIIQMALSFMAALIVLMFFVQRRLDKERRQIEDAAKKYGMASHADMYVSMHLIDLKDNSIHTLSHNNDFDLMKIEDGGNVIRKIKDSFIATVDDSTLSPLLDFINLKNLPERLKNKHVISQEFLSKRHGWCKAYFMVVDDEENGGAFNQVIFAVELIHEEKQKEKLAEDFRIRSETDLMTGLKNRGGGERAIRELMAQGQNGMFCLMDADKFKSINDNYGHGVGDKVIIAIANCLKNTFRTYDITMRLGGDEFAVYAVGIVDDEIGKNVINRLFRKIDDILIPELGDRRITISLGSALFNAEENPTFEELYKRADLGTYESKKVQGNCHTCYSPELKKD